MFTGIVQGMGKVTDIAQPSPDFRTHTVELPPEIADNLPPGASVANNGCCLTITRIDGNKVSCDLMAETVRKTNLGSLKVGGSVDLECAA
ncbi:riboflavin synthase, partial [Neisseria sp. P0021.S002]